MIKSFFINSTVRPPWTNVFFRYLVPKMILKKMPKIFDFREDFESLGRIYKNMWRKVGDCGTFRIKSGGSGHVYG